MTRRLSLADLPAAHLTLARKRYAAAGGNGAAPRAQAAQKFGNKATTVDGYRFASRLEADVYCDLRLRWRAGDVAWFIRQVPFDVAPGSRYLADFLVVHRSREVEILDAKGRDTPNSATKRKVVEDRYGLRIRIVKREDVQRYACRK